MNIPPNRIENYDDLMKEYMRQASQNGYIKPVDYNSPIKTIEPLPPLDNLYSKPKRDNIIYSQPNSNNYSNDYTKEKERQKEIQRKKQLEYQEILKQQMEEKQRRKKLEKEQQMKEDLLYEQKYLNYLKSNNDPHTDNSRFENNKSNPKVNPIVNSTNNNNYNIALSKNEIYQELCQSHPGIENILSRLNINKSNGNIEPQYQPNNEPHYDTNINQQIPMEQYESNPNPNYYAPMTNQNEIAPNYSYGNIQMPNVALSTPNVNLRQLNNPFNNNLSGHNFCVPKTPIPNIIRPPMTPQPGMVNVPQGQNNFQYPPILEKMLEFFFQEQVKIIKDYKETIEQLKNERDQAMYLNKANEEKIQVLERLRRDQDKIENQIGFSPFDPKYKKNLENTLTSMIDREEPYKKENPNYYGYDLNFKSKYENLPTNKNIKEESEQSTIEKGSLVASTKFVKQTGEDKLLETWVKDDHPIDTRKNELNDLSAITKQNLCDDKSFSQDLNNSFNIETNEDNNVCFPKVYQDNSDESDIDVKKVKTPKNIDNNVTYREDTNDDAHHDRVTKDNIDNIINRENELNIEEQNDKDNEKENENDEKFEIENNDIDEKVEIKKEDNTSDEASIEEKIDSDQEQNQNNNTYIPKPKMIEINDLSVTNQPENDELNKNEEDEQIPEDIPTNNEPISTIPPNPSSKNSTINSNIILIPREQIQLNDSFQKNPFSLAPSLRKSTMGSQAESNMSNQNNDMINKMTFFDDDSGKLEPSLSQKPFGSFKYNPQIRYPREVTTTNIKNLNNIYEKFKKKKNSTIESEKKITDENHEKSISSLSKYNNNNSGSDMLLNESLNTFTNNLNVNNIDNSNINDNVNHEDEIIMKKVNKFTKVALDEIGQSQLSVFNKEKTVQTKNNL